MTELICVICPKGCRLKVDESLRVSGNSCARGEAYGREEVLNPMRMVTSTVRVEGGVIRRCPVRTAGAISKSLIFDAMSALDEVVLTAPVRAGQTIVSDVCGAGVDFVATRDIPMLTV